MKKPYKLKLTKLEFLSSCDVPAQGEGGAALLLKRDADEFRLTAKVSKLDESLGLVFGYAFATSLDGGKTPHVDSQDDAIDPDFLKVVTEFLEAGGKTDVNHDFATDGKIVYAWPLLPEINEAMGIKSNTFGLAVAVKPSAETFAAYKRGELQGFSIAGTGIREPLEKGRVLKGSLYTNEVDGHQHKICVYEDGMMHVEWATMEGADQGHSHGIVFENGQLTILADSGHTHELAEGQAGIALVPADAVVIVAARAKVTNQIVVEKDPREVTRAMGSYSGQRAFVTGKSTRPTEPVHGGSKMETKIIVLTDAQHAHYAKLSATEGEAFLAKSLTERDAEIQKALDSDPVVFKGDLTGFEVRKSQGDFAKKLAEAAERSAKQLAEQADALAKRDEAIEKAEVRKQAAEVLAGMPGDNDTHDYIVASLRKGGDKVKAEKALETLKGMRDTSTIGKAAPGANPGSDPKPVGNEFEALEKGLVKFAKDKNIKNVWTEGLAAFAQTDEGAALKRAYDQSRNAG